MSQKDDGGSAFPIASPDEENLVNGGISLRDYFAANAISGFFANQYQDKYSYQEQTIRAYEVADAMLKERDREV